MKKLIYTTLVAAGLSAPMAAQDPAAAQAADQLAAIRRELEVVAQARGGFGIESRITPAAPYSAEAVTESNQVLADGNRISRKTVSRIYRDSEGRTRREEIDPEAGTVKSVVIADPVARNTFNLDPSTRTATRSQVFIAAPAGVTGGGRGGRGGGGGGVPVPAAGGGGARGGGGGVMRPVEPPEAAEVRSRAAAEARTAAEAKLIAEGTAVKPAPVPPAAVAPSLRAVAPGVLPTVEQLGTQTIEGVAATGTRSTTVIPAGAIGNLQPIKIVSEQWMSTDLKVLVMTRHSDPRSGETSYRLQNIVRAEPDRSLFSIPADYTVKEQPVRQPMAAIK